jgi:hypothetical protein
VGNESIVPTDHSRQNFIGLKKSLDRGAGNGTFVNKGTVINPT